MEHLAELKGRILTAETLAYPRHALPDDVWTPKVTVYLLKILIFCLGGGQGTPSKRLTDISKQFVILKWVSQGPSPVQQKEVQR